MSEPYWLNETLLLALYEDIVDASGGAVGVRDHGLLESAIARARNRYIYEAVTDLCELAATYAVAITRNHPFVDGNKRMAFMALGLFLEDNGLVLAASDRDATETMIDVAAGRMEIPALAAWLAGVVRPIS
jgi:death on curing protein